MDRAKDYLDPSYNKRKSAKPTKKQIKENEIYFEYDRPENRTQCPTYRPCPFVSCRYNMYLDVKPNGSITVNYNGIEPHQLTNSCVFDVVEDNPSGMPLGVIGEVMNLTRERVRQIEVGAMIKVEDSKN